MKNLLTSWRVFDAMKNFLTSWRTFYVMTCCLRHDLLLMSWRTVYDVMTTFLTSLQTFWRHDVFLTSWRIFDFMTYFWLHEVFLTSWLHDKLFDIMTNLFDVITCVWHHGLFDVIMCFYVMIMKCLWRHDELITHSCHTLWLGNKLRQQQLRSTPAMPHSCPPQLCIALERPIQYSMSFPSRIRFKWSIIGNVLCIYF